MSLDIRPNPSAAGSVTGGLTYKGEYNVTTNSPDLTTSVKGDFYIVNPDAGTLAGVSINVGDHIVFNQDAASPLTSAMFDVIDNTDAVSSVNGQTGPVVLDTDDISEEVGATNLYYTNARFDTQLGTKDTDDLSEGATNLYFTNARADGRIAAANMTDLNDVNYTAGAGIDGQFLKYVNANSRWEAASVPASSDTLDDVVGRGSTTTTSITTGGLTVTGDIDPNATNTYFIGDETNRFISYYGDMNGAIRFKAKNNSGVTLNKGEVVYIDGLNGTVPTVDKAQSNAASTMPSFGLVYANANDQAEVQVVTFGNLEDIDTSGFALGDTLYISSTTAGELVNTPPTGESNFIQNIGKVLKVHASAGIIKVGGAGRANATPNLNQDKIFLGNASNQAVSTALSSVNLSSFNNNLDTDDISEGTSNLYYTNARFDTQLATKTTDNLTEGVTNLYYTNARFDTQLGTKTTDNLTEGVTNLYYTNARFDTQLATKDTGDLSEGTNLYYTNARADARIAAANLTDLNDVNYTAGAGIDGYVLKYVNANSRWEAQAESGGGGSALPPEVKETTTTTPVSVSLTPSDSNSYTDLEVMYLVNNSSTAVELDLPTASGNEGKKIHIKRTGTADVTIDPNGTEQIDNGGAGTAFVLTSQYQSVSLISNGTNWFIF